MRMLNHLRGRLIDRLDRVDVLHTDLMSQLPVTALADAAFSVATFHWLSDHLTGAQFVAECGGEGNLACISSAAREVFGDTPAIWNFAGVSETEQRLALAGFIDVDVSLRPDPVRLNPGRQLQTYLATVILGAHLEVIPEGRRESLVQAVAGRLSEPIVDYVRLEISARRAD
jgi:trans-aconitate 2-methyltransferase